MTARKPSAAPVPDSLDSFPWLDFGHASDDGKGSGALHALLAEVGGTPYDPENDPRYNGAPAKKKGGKR